MPSSVSETGFLSLAPETYDIYITATGDTTSGDPGDQDLPLAGGDVITAIARDPDPNVLNDPFGVIVLTE